MGGGQRPGKYIGEWGDLGSQPQKGITTYSLSANRQRPMAGAMRAAVFNTYRRCRSQFFYVVPPFVFAYFAMDWAEKKNHWLNSKEGRLAMAAKDE